MSQPKRTDGFAFRQLKGRLRWQLAAALSLAILIAAGCSTRHGMSSSLPKVDFIEIRPDIKLRRMVVSSPNPKGVLLLLHGFPETLYSWKDIALSLGDEYDVHAFDWPGYGLSSRPPVKQFAYAPKDYATVLRDYVAKSGIERARLVIYATDIGALPALLLAMDEPRIARLIVVGDFAPFDRPQYMYPSLQSLKSRPSSDVTRAYMNKAHDEILENAYRRGLSKEEQFDISQELKEDIYRGWNQENMTSADAFYYYYSNFTRDQNHLESNLSGLTTPIKVIWGEKDIYIKSEMGVEFSKRTHSELIVLPGLGHYPHLQSPGQTIRELRSLVP